jgi:hypothetical protein
MERETPAQHFGKCGPFCPHTEVCKACANVFSLCKWHRADPDKSITWNRPTPNGED